MTALAYLVGLPIALLVVAVLARVVGVSVEACRFCGRDVRTCDGFACGGKEVRR